MLNMNNIKVYSRFDNWIILPSFISFFYWFMGFYKTSTMLPSIKRGFIVPSCTILHLIEAIGLFFLNHFHKYQSMTSMTLFLFVKAIDNFLLLSFFYLRFIDSFKT